ncbi:meteorin-like protein [Arapaima gigas]
MRTHPSSVRWGQKGAVTLRWGWSGAPGSAHTELSTENSGNRETDRAPGPTGPAEPAARVRTLAAQSPLSVQRGGGPGKTGMGSPWLCWWSSVVVVWVARLIGAQYSSDQCSWRGSGLMHESHARDVEQVYLRCSQGSLEWLYPTGAVIVNLRPNMVPPPPGGRLSVCIRPLTNSRGSNIYLERVGQLRLLLTEQDQAQGKITCFGFQEGVLFIEALPQHDISRKITTLQYELVNDTPSHSVPCQPCSDADVLMAVCMSDFVARGTIQGVEEGSEQTSVTVALSRLYRQKSHVFAAGGGRVRRWTGRVLMPPQCRVRPGEGDFLFTGSVRFGEAWLGCAPRYHDFLRLYQDSLKQSTNPCQTSFSPYFSSHHKETHLLFNEAHSRKHQVAATHSWLKNCSSLRWDVLSAGMLLAAPLRPSPPTLEGWAANTTSSDTVHERGGCPGGATPGSHKHDNGHTLGSSQRKMSDKPPGNSTFIYSIPPSLKELQCH